MSVLSIRPTVLQCYEIVLIVRFMPNNPPDITLPNSVVNSKTQSKKRRILFIFYLFRKFTVENVYMQSKTKK